MPACMQTYAYKLYLTLHNNITYRTYFTHLACMDSMHCMQNIKNMLCRHYEYIHYMYYIHYRHNTQYSLSYIRYMLCVHYMHYMIHPLQARHANIHYILYIHYIRYRHFIHSNMHFRHILQTDGLTDRQADRHKTTSLAGRQTAGTHAYMHAAYMIACMHIYTTYKHANLPTHRRTCMCACVPSYCTVLYTYTHRLHEPMH